MKRNKLLSLFLVLTGFLPLLGCGSTGSSLGNSSTLSNMDGGNGTGLTPGIPGTLGPGDPDPGFNQIFFEDQSGVSVGSSIPELQCTNQFTISLNQAYFEDLNRAINHYVATTVASPSFMEIFANEWIERETFQYLPFSADSDAPIDLGNYRCSVETYFHFILEIDTTLNPRPTLVEDLSSRNVYCYIDPICTAD